MSLKQKNEDALKTVLAAALAAANVSGLTLLTSQQDGDVNRQKQSVLFDDLGGPEFPLNTGNYHRRVRVSIWTTADKQRTDTETRKVTHAANVTRVTNALNKKELPALLSAAQDDYHCFAVVNLGPVPVEPKDRFLIDAFEYKLVSCESDMT